MACDDDKDFIKTIKISYCDLLDIFRDLRTNGWERYPCNIDAFAKYVWKTYSPNTDKNECDH